MEDMTLTGTYRIYEDGVLISEKKNLLTTYGSREMLRIMAGQSAPISRIGVGVLETAPDVSDVSLGMPLADSAVNFVVPIYNGASSKIIYKSRLSELTQGMIHELATYNSFEINEPVITNFSAVDDVDATMSTGPVGGGTDDIRMAGQGVTISTADPTISVTKQMSAGMLMGNDSIGLALKATGSGTIQITFTDSEGSAATGNFAFTGTNYQVVKVDVNSFTVMPIGSAFNWSDMTGVVASRIAGSATYTLDGLAAFSVQQAGQILSHAVYPSPVQKRLGVRYDIEYEVNFDMTPGGV